MLDAKGIEALRALYEESNREPQTNPQLRLSAFVAITNSFPELLARAAAWERVRCLLSSPIASDTVNREIAEVSLDFERLAEKGFAP